MLLVRTYQKCRTERLITVLRCELCYAVHADVVAHITPGSEFRKISLGLPIILHAFRTDGYQLNSIMVTGLLKVLMASVELKLRLDIRVIPEAIEIFCISQQKIQRIHGARAAAAMKEHLPHQPFSPFLSEFCQSSMEIFS